MKSCWILIGLVTQAFAHHGQDFFLALDARPPTKGDFTGFTSLTWSDSSTGRELSLEPGIIYGLGSGCAIGTSISFSETPSDPLAYSGVSPMLTTSLPTLFHSVHFGFSASYHFSDNSFESSEQHIHNTPLPDPGNLGGNPDAPSDGESVSHTHNHSHRGIHRHGESYYQFRAIAEWQLTSDTRIVANAITIGTSTQDIDLGYALALRHNLTDHWGMGVEIIGDMNRHGYHEAIAGIFWSPSHRCTIRLGAGRGIGGESKDITLSSGFAYHF